MKTDWELILEYREGGSDDAFAAIVQRHTNLVHSVVRRHLPDGQLVDDAVQAVWIVLARKAKTMSSKTVVPGWLVKTATYVAKDAQKMDTRRRLREQAAAEDAAATSADSEDDGVWQKSLGLRATECIQT